MAPLPDGPPARTVRTDRGDAGRRLDLVLRRHLADVANATRTGVQALIVNGHVTRNGRLVRRVSTRAAAGDVLTIVLPASRPRTVMAAEDVSVRVLYEDDHLLAIDKPPGIVVHPTHGHAAGTMMNALLWHARGWPGSDRPSLVGRLDKLTSGLLLVAKSPTIHAALQRAPIDKDYLAVVYGRVNEANGRIDLRLARDERDRRKVVASTAAGAASLTHFERLASVAAPRAGLSLLRCRLVTGRTHQIRVHLASRGWPLVGDPTYGEPRWTLVRDAALSASLEAFPRQALHAWRVAFVHPVTRSNVHIEAPLPADMDALLVSAGLPSLATLRARAR